MNHRAHRDSDGIDPVDRDCFVDDEDSIDPALNQITNRIIACAIAVHRSLGPGYLEAVYHNAMCVELARQGLRFVREFPFVVEYQGHVVGNGRLDLLVEDDVIVELKAVESLGAIHTAVAMSYLKATGKRLCLMLNFHAKMLKDGIKRVVR